MDPKTMRVLTLRYRRLREATGSSLVETLAALALFAMSTATVGDFLVDQIRAAGSNGQHTRAYEMGIQEIESIRSLPYDEISSGSEQFQKGKTLYSVTTSVEEDAAGPGLKTVTVDVSWEEPGGTRHVVLETIDSATIR